MELMDLHGIDLERAAYNTQTSSFNEVVFSPERALGHELVHAAIFDIVDSNFIANWLLPHSYVIGKENIIATQLDPGATLRGDDGGQYVNP